MSNADQIRGRFIYNKSDTLDTNANLPVFWTNLPQRFYMVNVGYYHAFAPKLANELRLGCNRFRQLCTTANDTFPGLDKFPNLTFDNDLGLQLGPDSNAMYIKSGLGAYANGGRNTIPTPGINNFDISLAKIFKITEGKSVEFRADMVNAFNHPQYTSGLVNSVKLTTQSITRVFLLAGNSNFQKWSENFSINPRSIQMALRFKF
jgi:hypothetical protein